MDAYIARQPIFDRMKKVVGYELLYRDGAQATFASFSDGDQATCRLLSDAITLFGLSHLTDELPAFVNFTRNLILNDFARLARPHEIVIEVLEEQQVDAHLVAKLQELHEAGYTIALDDYAGAREYDGLLPFIDIIKVDLRQTDLTMSYELIRHVKRIRPTGLTLLAEKVETEREFEAALRQGYTQFQGYFFEQPVTMAKELPVLTQTSSWSLLCEVQKRNVDFERCAQIIHSDVTLTYRVMRHVQVLKYYRGNSISATQQALVMMGIEEIRRWTLLMLARENNITQTDELIRASYLRGTFIKRLMEETSLRHRSDDGFLIGMFSYLERILGIPLPTLLKDIHLPKDVENALLARDENALFRFLQYAMIYESGNASYVLPELDFFEEHLYVPELYMESIIKTDKAFHDVEGELKS